MVLHNRLKLAFSLLSLGIMLLPGVNQPALAKTKKHSTSTTQTVVALSGDEQVIRAHLATFGQRLAAGDAAGLAQMWTQDGEYVDEDGVLTKGRAAIEKRFTLVFSQEGKPQVHLSADTVKFLAPTVALVEGLVQRDHDGHTRPGSRFSLLMVKGDSGWLLSTASERPVIATSNYDYLRHFEWIIGDWNASSASASVHMNAEWVPSKNFILCKYETRKADGTVSIDMQVIGWDPILDQPRSFHFDSTGGFGQGLWTKQGNQWICDTSGVESDGSTTKSRNIIQVEGADSFTWSSINRSVDGMAVGDAPTLQVKRTGK